MTPQAIVPYGYCHCRCGFKTNIIKKSNPRCGHVAGEPYRYILGHQSLRKGPRYTVEDRGHVTPCWIWNLSCDSSGYGLLRDRAIFGGCGKQRMAHILYWEKVNGPTPQGFELHHKCHVKRCVNPDHLEPVTRQEHAKLGRRPKKTHCHVGHEFTQQNTGHNGGVRYCKACFKVKNQRRWRERKAKQYGMAGQAEASG